MKLGPDAGLTLADQFTHLFEEALEGEAATLIVSSLTTDDVHPAQDEATQPWQCQQHDRTSGQGPKDREKKKQLSKFSSVRTPTYIQCGITLTSHEVIILSHCYWCKIMRNNMRPN